MQSPKTAKAQTEFSACSNLKNHGSPLWTWTYPTFPSYALYNISCTSLFFPQQLSAFHLTNLEQLMVQYLLQVNIGIQTEAAKVWTTNFPTSTWPAQPPEPQSQSPKLQYSLLQYKCHTLNIMTQTCQNLLQLTIIVVKQATTTLWKKCRFRVHRQWEWAGRLY